MLAPTAILLMADSVTLLYGLFIPICYIGKRSPEHVIRAAPTKRTTKGRIFPFSWKGANSYLLHPPWIQAPIHCSPRLHFLATSAGRLWSAASAVPVCWSCLFPTWADRGNSPGRSLCSHPPRVSPEATPGLNSAGRQPNVAPFCRCTAPAWK